MPTIFDNFQNKLLDDLSQKIESATRADFCVGYFNLRGWRLIDEKIEQFAGGDDACCRLLVGMIRHPQEELIHAFGTEEDPPRMTQGEVNELKKELVHKFREQIEIGLPTNMHEAGLQRLKKQLLSGKLQVKLFLRYPLHAKLYLLHYPTVQPQIGYLGSSNLTFPGLSGQGELNIDVRDTVATQTLVDWFDERWEDRFAIDITPDLIEIIEKSWAGERLLPPYYIYLKMAYHLSREAQRGIDEYQIPAPFNDILFEYQRKAVQIAARNLNQRNGVLIGDVVGLGKTLMATALVKIFQEDLFMETLILCPKNLERMWQYHVDTYGLKAKVLPISQAQQKLPELTRFRLVLIDESHNLRNREGKRYRVIREYIERNECRCILLSATPYNKSYLDLANQLRLFVDPEMELPIRPERLIQEMGIVEFNRKFENLPPRTLAAFEKSSNPDDWRELMRLFMVRRTRSFIREHYTKEDENGRYLSYPNGRKDYFPTRHPKRLDFADSPQYQRLYSADVVDTINDLNLPRYGLGLYVKKAPNPAPTVAEQQIIDDLSRGGKRLMGFSRTNLFKRLESSGHAFILSVQRHILRNYVFLHALENDLPLPIGTQDIAFLDTRFEDEDVAVQDEEDENGPVEPLRGIELDPTDFEKQGGIIYDLYATQYRRRFKWLRANLFNKSLRKTLEDDALNLMSILHQVGSWDPRQDTQLNALEHLLTKQHRHDKVLIFSQFADTVTYLTNQLQARGVRQLEGVTGGHADPTLAAWRFSPRSNQKGDAIAPEDEVRVLIATDVLSEGQNLQDAFVVLNYDLPWAIIRLIQRAGRVDRIGQQSQDIYCYSMWPAEGIERIINLRSRLRHRLQENAEVVGADETFFEDEEDRESLGDLYNERSGVLDDDEDREIDLISYAYQIWDNAIKANPPLEREIARLPNVVYSSKALPPGVLPPGVLVYLKTAHGSDGLAWMDEAGNSVTTSQYDILQAAACALDEPALRRQENHHDLVKAGVLQAQAEQQAAGVQLGRTSGARFKAYERLKSFLNQSPLLAELPFYQTLKLAVEQMGTNRLRETAKDQLNRQLRSDIGNEHLARIVVALYEENKLCLVQEEASGDGQPQIICSLGLQVVPEQIGPASVG